MSAEKFDDLDWIPVKNSGSQTIPAFGVVMLDGIELVEGKPTWKVKRPTDSLQHQYFINSFKPIPQGKFGLVTAGPYFTLIDTSESSAAVETGWGPVKDQFYLKKYRPGFYCHGGYSTTPAKKAIFTAEPITTFQGKISGSDVKLWGDHATTLVETTMKVSKKCWLSDGISGNYRVVCNWINGAFWITGASCEADEEEEE